MICAEVSVSFWSTLWELTQILVLVVVGAGVVIVLAAHLFETFVSAGHQVEERDTIVVPPALTLIGSVVSAAAESTVDELPIALTIVLIGALTSSTWLGSVLAAAAAEGRKSWMIGVLGYAIMLFPALVLTGILATSGRGLDDGLDQLTAEQTVALSVLGATILAIASSVFLIRARKRALKRA